MIPADLASRLRTITQELPAPVQPLQPAHKIIDALSNLSAGQRIMAEIQALLPNGTYRAVVAQRELTLALPFAAKAGDIIELEVIENDGKTTLAFIANRTVSDNTTKGNDSVATTLSKTGGLIGELLNGVDDQGGRAKPAILNSTQALVTEFPEKATHLAPILKDALIKSGMFYEAHQARWVEGKMPTSSLLQEPQGRLSTLTPVSNHISHLTDSNSSTEDIYDHVHLSTSKNAEAIAPEAQKAYQTGNDKVSNPSLNSETSQSQNKLIDNQTNTRASSISPELTPLVQQQLNALATQTYAWQGQVWPGQNMDWEITEDDGRPRSGDEEVSGQWQTRLKLSLPRLGGIEARIGLDTSGQLNLLIRTNEEDSKSALTAAASQLEKALQSSGLQLKQFAVTHAKLSD